MKDLTRREFLHTAAGAAVGGTIAGHDVFVSGQGAAAYSAPSPAADVKGDTGELSLNAFIFPTPREISRSGRDFGLDNKVCIMVPGDASEQDMFLARSLANELSDRFGLYLKVVSAETVPHDARTVLIGSLKNRLVSQYSDAVNLTASIQSLGPEGYILRTNNNTVFIAGSDDRGAFYGLQSLRQLLHRGSQGVAFRGVLVRDWPDKSFRGIYLFLPGRDNISFFKRFVRDFMALYKYNTLIMEMNACMRLDNHPELNYGWVQFARDTDYSCRNYPPGPFHGIEQNSSHQDTADGSFLEKEEVAELAGWVRKYHIELIPSLPSFTHSYYLLTEHRELAAVPQNKWPDIYCPSNPKSYSMVYEIYDEYLEVLKPASVHIGHDELFLPVGASSQCQDREISELFGEDVKRIHDYLAKKGVKTALWGDMLLQSVRGRGLQKKTAPDGWTYDWPGGLSQEQVERLIPKDCLIYNWFWSNRTDTPGSAEENELDLDRMGFQQVFGNFEPHISNYESRKKLPTLLGGAPSAWFAPNEIGFGKDLLSTFLGCSNILWSGQVMQGRELSARVQSMMPALRTRLSGINPPSQTEASFVPVDISSNFNMSDRLPLLDVNLSAMERQIVRYGRVPFDLRQTHPSCAVVVGTEGKQRINLPKAVGGILIGEAPTSLLFLHACARPAANRESIRLIWDQQDTADLLGWYEIVYEDGFVTPLPIRYGVNILEWNWKSRVSADNYCYSADAIDLGTGKKDSITFFAYEWMNARRGKVIREIRLKGTTGFRGGSDDFNNQYGPVLESNAVILTAVSLVKKRA